MARKSKKQNGSFWPFAIGVSIVAVAALALAGCEPKASTCHSAKVLYEKSLEEGWGGAAEKAAAKKVYDNWAAKCNAAGINI